MISLGIFNTLTIGRFAPPGAYLNDGEGNEVLLPNKYVPKDSKEGEKIEVFIYKDSEDRIVATTLKPFVELNAFAYLEVRDVNPIGAFLDWGLEKDLLVPFRQQQQDMQVGKFYLIYLYLDTLTDRLAATAKVDKHFETEEIDLTAGQEVDLLIAGKSDLGFNAVVNNRFRGLIYENEVYRELQSGDRVKGYVKQIRPDKKIDLSLQKLGMDQLETGAQKILDILQEQEGFLSLTDNSSPEEIQELLQMSKKNFKRSIGILYKQKKISLQENGIKLLSP